MQKHGYVIDTNILVSALKSKRGASYKLLSLLPSNSFAFHLSVPLVCEYESVLKRSELNLNWTTYEIDDLIDIICLLGIKHEIWYLWRPLLQDAKDDFVAELAVTAQAEAIVTHNIRDFKGLENVVDPKNWTVFYQRNRVQKGDSTNETTSYFQTRIQSSCRDAIAQRHEIGGAALSRAFAQRSVTV